MGRRLNTSTPTVIQTELVPLDENFTIEANGTLEQWYYDNNSQYAPDRSITPLILTPVLSVADKDSQQSWDNSQVTKSIVSWSVMEENTWVDITSTSALSNYELSGNNLVVHKNVPYSRGVTIRCKVTYIDPRDNGIYITTQETVLLTCNRDANVVLPEVAITSPSARSFNPLVDGASTEYDFDAVVTNSPDVEMQSSDIATYEIDGSGTEEIISDANGIAPILDIRYPDSETQTEQEFVYRQTANGEKPDEEGAAFISKIKGNTIAWNQMLYAWRFRDQSVTSVVINGITWTKLPNGSIMATGTATNLSQFTIYQDNAANGFKGVANHIYYGYTVNGGSTNTFYGTFINNGGGIGGITEKFLTACTDGTNGTGIVLRVNNGVTISNVIFKPMLIDLTLIYGEGNEPTTVEQFEADYERWFGKPLTYEEYDAGSIKPVLMQSVKTTGLNQFKEEWEDGLIDPATGLDTQSDRHVRTGFIRVFPSTQYTTLASDYPREIVFMYQYDENKNFLTTSSSKTITTRGNCCYLRLRTLKGRQNKSMLYMSENVQDVEYKPYEEHLASVPVTSAKGRLLDANGSPVGNSVFVFPDGLKKVGNVQDEIFVENGVVKAIKRVGSVDLGSLTWVKQGSGTTYFESSSINNITLSDNPNIKGNILTPIFNVVPQADFTNKDKSIIKQSYGNKNYVDVYSTGYNSLSNVEFKTAMQGVMLYYELATPETYVLDPVQSPFIFKWFGIDENSNEVLADTLPWYVSGQNTSKLKVDAMWGEKINVVLCAMMPTGAVSPSRDYANITWKIPDVDTTVVSQNGSAVRSNTSSMTFGTIVNLKGRNLSDMAKSAHLRFRWVYRKSTTAQETSAGWSQGQSDQITIQASNLRSVRAQDSTLTSTLVFPYVYCLGAWTTNQGTLTGYDKPTTTKNGVTYYRTVD